MQDLTLTLPRSGITLRGSRTDTRGGMPTLCLHGWLDNCASFHPMLEQLSDVDLVAVDLPGHGLSDPVGSVTCDYLNYAATVLEIAHALGWEKFQLIGHSLGGALSSIVAGLHPEKVSSLVLLDAIGPLTSSPQDTVAEVASYLRTYLGDSKHQRYGTRAQAVKARLQLADILLETAETLVERDLSVGADGYYWRHDIRLKRGLNRTITEEQVLAFLRCITAPTMLITAERTALVEDFYPARIASVPDLRQVTLPGGHHLHMENTHAVSEAIRGFLGGEHTVRVAC